MFIEAGRDEIGLDWRVCIPDLMPQNFCSLSALSIVFPACCTRPGREKADFSLRGPVGGGKSSIAECLKQMMELMSFYALKGSPISKSSLALFDNPALDDYPLMIGRGDVEPFDQEGGEDDQQDETGQRHRHDRPEQTSSPPIPYLVCAATHVRSIPPRRLHNARKPAQGRG